MKPTDFIFDLFKRLSSANPPFFKKIQAAFVVLAVFVMAAIGLHWNIPAIQEYLNWNTFSFLLLLAGFSQLPNNDAVKKVNGDEDLSDPTAPKPSKP